MGQLSSYTNTFTSGTDAVADEVNQNFIDIKDAHNATDTAALYKDGTKAMTGNLAMGSHKITGLTSGTASGDAVNKGQLDAVEAVINTAILKDGSVDLEDAQSYFTSAITGATNATPIVITSEDHGRSDNDYVLITDVAGNTAANGEWQITYVDADSFSLDGSVGNGTYTSGGNIYFLPSDLSNVVSNANLNKNSYVKNFGTISSGTITLKKDLMHEVTFSGAATIALPTGLTSGVHYNCSVLVTMSSVVTITQPTVTWAYGSAPTLTSTSVKYRLTYETIDGGTTWYGYWTQLGA